MLDCMSRLEESPPNVLAFSCEAANAMMGCSQNAARLRLLQRRVRPPKHLTHFFFVESLASSRVDGNENTLSVVVQAPWSLSVEINKAFRRSRNSAALTKSPGSGNISSWPSYRTAFITGPWILVAQLPIK